PIAAPISLARPESPPADVPQNFLRSIRRLKAVGSRNLHLPSIVCLGTDNRNSPVPRPVRKRMLDSCSHFPLQSRITSILHFPPITAISSPTPVYFILTVEQKDTRAEHRTWTKKL